MFRSLLGSLVLVVILAQRSSEHTSSSELNLVSSSESSSWIQDDEERFVNVFIYPGTKWCGIGDKANKFGDLGEYADEDRCCREHDQCMEYISPMSRKYGLFNPGLNYRFDCACEANFYRCLKRADSKVANRLGHLYFNLLGDDCFKFDHPIVRCVLSIPHKLLKKRCLRYEQDYSRSKTYQFFNVPPY